MFGWSRRPHEAGTRWDLAVRSTVRRRRRALPADRRQPRGRHPARTAAAGPAACPATRRLAATLGINRNTVVAAYDELTGGRLDRDGRRPRPARRVSRAARGRGRSAAPPRWAGGPQSPREPGTTCRHLPDGAWRTPARRSSWSSGGVPDLRLVPIAALLARVPPGPAAQPHAARLRTVPHGLASAARGAGLDAGGHARPRPPDRTTCSSRAAARWRSTWSRARSCSPGDVVAVEALGYRAGLGGVPRWRRAPGAACPGRRPTGSTSRRWRRCARSGRVRAVYLHAAPPVPHDRHALARAGGSRCSKLARAHRHRDHRGRLRPRVPLRRPARPARSPAPTARASSSTSARCRRSSRPGCALGLRGRAALRCSSRAGQPARVADRHQGDTAVEDAVAELLEDGEVQRHIRRVRRRYRARRDALAERLTPRPPGHSFRCPRAASRSGSARGTAPTSTSGPGARWPGGVFFSPWRRLRVRRAAAAVPASSASPA